MSQCFERHTIQIVLRQSCNLNRAGTLREEGFRIHEKTLH